MNRARPKRATRRDLVAIYDILLRRHGHAGWWPGDGPFEICVGAILTQNTAWSNVETVLAGLRARGLLSFASLSALPLRRLAPLLRASGYFNLKARRLKAFLRFVESELGGCVETMAAWPPLALRERLLEVDGIGRETADSIALYAAGQPLFVVDAYTRRVFSRLGYLRGDEDYDEVQRFFMERLPQDAALFNDFHAQIVLLAKDACRARPRCEQCVLRRRCPKRGVAPVRGPRPSVRARTSRDGRREPIGGEL